MAAAFLQYPSQCTNSSGPKRECLFCPLPVRSAVQVRRGDDRGGLWNAGGDGGRSGQGGCCLHGGGRRLRVLVYADGSRRLLHQHQVLQRHHRRLSAQGHRHRSLAVDDLRSARSYQLFSLASPVTAYLIHNPVPTPQSVETFPQPSPKSVFLHPACLYLFTHSCW